MRFLVTIRLVSNGLTLISFEAGSPYARHSSGASISSVLSHVFLLDYGSCRAGSSSSQGNEESFLFQRELGLVIVVDIKELSSSHPFWND